MEGFCKNRTLDINNYYYRNKFTLFYTYLVSSMFISVIYIYIYNVMFPIYISYFNNIFFTYKKYITTRNIVSSNITLHSTLLYAIV